MEKNLIYNFKEMTFAREPVIRRLPNGILIVTFLSGGPTEPHNDNALVVSKSYDDGKTWTKPKIVLNFNDRGLWATEISTLTEKPFIALHTYNTYSYKKEGYRELETFMLNIDENGEIIGEPISFKNLNGVSVRQGIKLSNGELLFPVYHQEVVFDFDWNKNTQEMHPNIERYPFRCSAAICDKDDMIFNRFGYLYAEKSLWEPNAIEAENGHVIMFMRSNNEDYLRRSDSYDYGRTWSKPIVTEIENAHTKVTLFKIEDKIFMINNFVCANGMANRKNLCIYRSDDNGKTFNYLTKFVDKDEAFFYPHACVSEENKTVYITYENMIEHYIVKYTFDELLK